MIKFRSLHLVMTMCIFSLALSAQNFKSGQQAIEDLNSQHITVKQDFISDMIEAGFDTAEAYVDQEPQAAKGFLFLKSTQLNINPSSTPAQVGEALKALIIEKSQDYVLVTSVQYDAGELGSQEIRDLYTTLIGIVAQ